MNKLTASTGHTLCITGALCCLTTTHPSVCFQVLCYPVEEEENMESPTGSKKSKEGKDKKDAKGKVGTLSQGRTDTLTPFALGTPFIPCLSLCFSRAVVISMVALNCLKWLLLFGTNVFESVDYVFYKHLLLVRIY